MIYFIENAARKAIKIGYASEDPAKRMRLLQCGSPDPLTMLGWIPGGFKDEKRLHRRFAAYRIRRTEWFDDVPELRTAVRELLGEIEVDIRSRITCLDDISLDNLEQRPTTPTERAYRRGVHQALEWASDVADDAPTIGDARKLLLAACNEAYKLRFDEDDRGRACLMHELRRRLSRKGVLR